MNESMLATLQELDRGLLTHLVRQDQRSQAFEVIEWTVDPIPHAKILDTTGGLYRFSGHGQDGDTIKSWSIVLKILNKPTEDHDLRDPFYWKRELLAFQSGLLANLPGVIRAPRSYGVVEHSDGGWLWMEDIKESTERRWSLEHFQRAAYEFGRFGGAYLTDTPLPDQPWLSRPLFQALLADGGFWPTFMDPVSETNAWQSPVVQQVFTEPLRSQILMLWTEKVRFRNALDRLPQVFCHNDLNRRNMMFRKMGQGHDELIVLDWAWCGNGAIGLDIGWMVADGLYFFDYDPARVAELEAAVLEGYLEGLRDAGWYGDEQQVRLGYLIPAAIFMGLLPGWAAMMLSQGTTPSVIAMYGHSAEAVLEGWVTLAEFFLERLNEARYLMEKLGMA